MGKGISVKVSNSKAVGSELIRYGKKTGSAILKEIQLTALMVESKAKIRVPKDKSILASSITAKHSNTGSKVSTNMVYGPYIEFTKPEGTGPHGGPRPYLFPSYKEERPKLIAKIKKILGKKK